MKEKKTAELLILIGMRGHNSRAWLDNKRIPLKEAREMVDNVKYGYKYKDQWESLQGVTQRFVKDLLQPNPY